MAAAAGQTTILAFHCLNHFLPAASLLGQDRSCRLRYGPEKSATLRGVILHYFLGYRRTCRAEISPRLTGPLAYPRVHPPWGHELFWQTCLYVPVDTPQYRQSFSQVPKLHCETSRPLSRCSTLRLRSPSCALSQGFTGNHSSGLLWVLYNVGATGQGCGRDPLSGV